MGVAIAPSDHKRVYLITGESLGNDKGFFVSDNGDRSLAAGGPTFVIGGHAAATRASSGGSAGCSSTR